MSEQVSKDANVFLILLITAGAFGADLFSKVWIDSQLLFGQRKPLVHKVLSVVRSSRLNRGALFGTGEVFGKWSNRFLITVGSLATIGIFYWVCLKQHPTGWILAVALALIAGGTLSNLYDRILLGGVRDYFALHLGMMHTAKFNLADCCLFIGAALFCGSAFKLRPIRAGTV